MKINLTIDISKILPNPEQDIQKNPVQESYHFVSSKHPEIIKEIIKNLEDSE